MAKWRTFKSPFVDSNPSSRRAALNSGKARASQLLDRGQTEAALAILEPLAADYQQRCRPADDAWHVLPRFG